jgi:hypothetical protein
MAHALPILQLDDIRIASPCSMKWEDMTGGDRVRHCAACQKNVFNLSALKRSEALDLIRATEGRLCARFYRRADGTILTSDCPVGLARLARRAKRMALGAVATSLGAVAALLAVLAQAPFGRTCDLPAPPKAIEQTIERVKVMRDQLVVPEVPHEAVAGGLG